MAITPQVKNPLPILIVEDNEALRRVLADLFELEGYVVYTSGTGREALELARSHPTALAVLDLKLPDTHGMELLKALREIEPRTWFIVHTGYGTFRSARDAVNEGVFAYVEKLGDPRELIRHVHRAAQAWLNAAFEECRSQYLAVLRAVPDVLYVIDAQGRYREEFLAELGTHVDSFRGMAGKLLEDVLSASEAARARRAIRRVLEGEEPVDHEYQVGSDGTARWYTARIVRLRVAGEQRVLWVARDITGHIRIEADLREAKAQADEVSKLKTALLANMSHEIRTPLASILGFSAIIEKEVPDELREFVTLIEASGKRLLDTLNSVLDLSMLEAGSYRLSHVVLNIVDHVRKQVEEMKPRADSKNVALVVELDAEVIEARVDPVCLDRIVHNLIGNAIKFTDEGRVTVRVSASEDSIHFSVEDTGIGISPEFLPRIFDEFRQESSGIARLYGGSGLGLSITRRLVNLMEGEIRVKSRKGVGSMFSVRVPRGLDVLSPSLPRLKPRREPLRALSSNGTASRRASVLVLEDNPESKRLLEYVLGDTYHVDAAGTEEEALALAGQTKYDAVFLDINLGQIRTGIDVKEALRKMNGYAGTPIVALTAYALPGDREHFLHAGFDEYISKPFTRKDLLGVVSQLLSDSQ